MNASDRNGSRRNGAGNPPRESSVHDVRTLKLRERARRLEERFAWLATHATGDDQALLERVLEAAGNDSPNDARTDAAIWAELELESARRQLLRVPENEREDLVDVLAAQIRANVGSTRHRTFAAGWDRACGELASIPPARWASALREWAGRERRARGRPSSAAHDPDRVLVALLGRTDVDIRSFRKTLSRAKQRRLAKK